MNKSTVPPIMDTFFQKWLAGGKGDARDEPDARLAPADLVVTETGQVSTSLHARTIADLVADHAPPRTAPPSTSYSRGTSDASVDFPAPDEPTSATVCPGPTVNETPCSTSSPA